MTSEEDDYQALDLAQEEDFKKWVKIKSDNITHPYHTCPKCGHRFVEP
jgi:hypothetical protein